MRIGGGVKDGAGYSLIQKRQVGAEARVTRHAGVVMSSAISNVNMSDKAFNLSRNGVGLVD